MLKNFFVLIFATFFVLGCNANLANYSNNKQDPVLKDALEKFQTAKYQESAKLLASYAIDHQLDNEIKFTLAESLRLSEKPQDSIKYYDEIIKANSNDISAYEGKALALIDLGKFSDAESSLNLILEQDATRWRTLNALGIIYALNGKKKESEQYYLMAADLSDNNPTILNNLGLTLLLSGNVKQGLKQIKAAKELPTSDSEIAKKIDFNLALAYGISKDEQSATEILKKYLNDSQIANNLGYYAKLAKDKSLAKKHLNEALSMSPVHYEKAWNNLESIK